MTGASHSVHGSPTGSPPAPLPSPFVSLACRHAYAELATVAARVVSELSFAMASPRENASLASGALQELYRAADRVDSTWIQDEALGASGIAQALGELARTIDIALPATASIRAPGTAFMSHVLKACEFVARFVQRLTSDPASADRTAFDDAWSELDDELATLAETWRRAESSQDRRAWEEVSRAARYVFESVGEIAFLFASWCLQSSFSKLRFETQHVTVTGALGAGEYALASTVSAASESVEVRKLGNPGGAAAEPVLGRIFRAGTALPQFVPDTSSPLGFMPSLAILKLVAAGYFLGGGREGAGDVYVVFPDDLPLEHPNAHASIGRDAGAARSE
jgi:hypothetical protein